jgi:hypothetical protein
MHCLSRRPLSQPPGRSLPALPEAQKRPHHWTPAPDRLGHTARARQLRLILWHELTGELLTDPYTADDQGGANDVLTSSWPELHRPPGAATRPGPAKDQ